MRVLPVINRYNRSAKKVDYNTTKFERFERKNDFRQTNRRIYSGKASIDLAYASMFDNAIAKDLKLMGLI